MKWVRNSLISIALIFGVLGLSLVLKLDWELFSLNGTKKCAFCNQDVLKQNTFYEGTFASALLTHKPVFEGHVLILPKRHIVRFDELTDAEMVEIKQIIQKIDRVSQKIYGTTGYLLMEKNGREAGQTVPHVHFHYMPRKQNANVLISALQIMIKPLLKPLSPEEMETERKKLALEMSR